MFLLVLLCTVAVSCLLRNVIRKVPGVFYVLAVAMVVLYFVSDVVAMPRSVTMPLIYLVRRGFLATAIFVFVMYIGVFPRGTSIRRFLQPLRAPLSIVGCILVLAHIVEYLVSYVPRLMGGTALRMNVLIAFWLGILLFVLALVLGVTSFTFVKKHMKAATWKKVQWFAYIFYAAMFIHMCVMLLPSVVRGSSTQAIMTTGCYVVLFVAYFVARIYRGRVEKAKGIQGADLSLSQAKAEEEEAKL